MSAYRELIRRGDADHTQLSALEFLLYTEAKLQGGNPVLSEAAQELAAMQAVVEAARELKEAMPMDMELPARTWQAYRKLAAALEKL